MIYAFQTWYSGNIIFESISTSQVDRLLRGAELQPHESRYWLNTTEKDPQQFQAQVQTVCACYHDAPTLFFQQNTHTISIDEMTGIQALERTAATLEMKPGLRACEKIHCV